MFIDGLAVGPDGATLVVDGADRTCEAECDGACCISTNEDGTNNVCAGFTGRVCKDNVSCDGPNSCTDATMAYVVKSCSGVRSCNKGGSNGKIVNSCVLNRSCLGMGENAAPWDATPTMGDVIDSCHGEFSCKHLGRGASSVGNVLNSCNRLYDCHQLASPSGGIGDIVGSCNHNHACRDSFRSTPVGDFNDCCNESQMCQDLLDADGVPDECIPVSEVCLCVMYSY